MNIKIEAEFEDKAEYEKERKMCRELLVAYGFLNVMASEDLITNRWSFRAEKKYDKVR